ncbi:unnamed protein product [Prunus armeniaca]|uniref:Uncharacterized protein n=1 Tax=Prunus armeniaca TaxID=36596 RepID=A0A6J5VT68_PRUAR|nr:unnamed protein product [Prunus armeniaca]
MTILAFTNSRTMLALSFISRPTFGELHNSTAALCGHPELNGSTFTNTRGMHMINVCGWSSMMVHVGSIMANKALMIVLNGTTEFDVRIRLMVVTKAGHSNR